MKDIGTSYNIYGNRWSQTVRWEIFPILIQMAIDRQAPITYGELADKAEAAGIKFKHKPEHRGLRARSMNSPLGCVLRTLFEYQEESGIDIPYLTTIVLIRTLDDLPTILRGMGGLMIGYELSKRLYTTLSNGSR